MEPVSTVMAFATLVSLIGQYRTERGDKKAADFNEFLVWLMETQHEQLKNAIESNSRTATGIKALLNEQFDSLQGRLDVIDESLATYASGFPGFSDIVSGIRPQAMLSEQAIGILRAFEYSAASKALKIATSDGAELLCVDSDAEFEIPEVRFLDDDLQRLVELGILRMDYNSRGDPLFIFTRMASQLVREMDSNQTGEQ